MQWHASLSLIIRGTIKKESKPVRWAVLIRTEVKYKKEIKNDSVAVFEEPSLAMHARLHTWPYAIV